MQSKGDSPVPVQIWHVQIGPSAVDVTFSAFGNMNMLVFTDTGSMGVLMKASGDGGIQASGTYTIQTLLGRRDCEAHQLVARQLIALSHSKDCSKPLLVGLGVKDLSQSVAKELLAFAKENIKWP
eukprot:jgi/Ulvmu1/3245/UM150_0018.1